MLNVFFTIDVEISCNGWQNSDAIFANVFDRYIHGNTPQGQFGLPYQLKVLNDHGLTSVCFIEALFSACFGQQPLNEIVSLVCEAGHEVQLHMHPEWVSQARTPLLENMQGNRPNMRDYSLAEQTSLIASGMQMLKRAGAPEINAFRAGSFGFNRDTLEALAANGIAYDSSYNLTMFGPTSGVKTGESVWWPFECANVYEYPMTVFDDGTGKLRHVQLTACSFSEFEKLLWGALEAGYSSFVILSHSFELLNGSKRDRSDPVAINRFRKLCAFMEKNRDVFCVRGFQGLAAKNTVAPPPVLRTPLWQTGRRMIEQVYRRRYG